MPFRSQDVGGLRWGRSADKRYSVTYEKLFNLKFKKGYSTNELIEKFPEEAGKVREIALLEIPTSVLKRTLAEDGLLERILSLKQKFSGRVR